MNTEKESKRIDKGVLKMAADIIQEELEAGRDVKIPGFGKFYLSRVNWTDKDTGDFGKVNTVRFRPFGALKQAVGNREMLGNIGNDEAEATKGLGVGQGGYSSGEPEAYSSHDTASPIFGVVR